MSKQLNVQIDEGLYLSLDLILAKLKHLLPDMAITSKSELVQILLTKALIDAATKCKIVHNELFEHNDIRSYVKKSCYGFFCTTCPAYKECRDGTHLEEHPGCPDKLRRYVFKPFLTLDELPTVD